MGEKGADEQFFLLGQWRLDHSRQALEIFQENVIQVEMPVPEILLDSFELRPGFRLVES